MILKKFKKFALPAFEVDFEAVKRLYEDSLKDVSREDLKVALHSFQKTCLYFLFSVYHAPNDPDAVIDFDKEMGKSNNGWDAKGSLDVLLRQQIKKN